MPSIQSMDQQPEIGWHMRPCLVEFLVEIHFSFHLRPEILYLAINIVDRYVSRRIVFIEHYQLIGCVALWIAAKFEDVKERVPSIKDLVQMCHDAYEESAFRQMEGYILSTIQWTLGHPTAETWLGILCSRGPRIEEPKVQHVARFLMEITLFYREFVKYPPSLISRAALALSCFLCRQPERFMDSETDECMEILDLLDTRFAKHGKNLSKVLVKKYSDACYSKVATFVIQFYLQGGRFARVTIPSFTNTPTPNTPLSDAPKLKLDAPITTTALNPSSSDYEDKENWPTTIKPVTSRQIDPSPEQYLPREFVTFSRPVLQTLNVC
ncbi:hypothetical protein BT96DRAFT_951551 [Gymnopus androsaceus JB14]|uniref:Uncharacterized protein n=1 Tax=Gymnopus androsaceus JB14 TaxID=1447944 RepID=A0A6A4GCP8_9AGAR|nr:hypothetical protein BT96DRAFT_951551 [Gymnopus androsaceus JB14]